MEEFLDWAFDYFGGVAVWTRASPEWAECALAIAQLARFRDRFDFVWTGERWGVHESRAFDGPTLDELVLPSTVVSVESSKQNTSACSQHESSDVLNILNLLHTTTLRS